MLSGIPTTPQTSATIFLLSVGGPVQCTQCTERSQAADHQVKEVKSVHIVQIVKNKMFINIFHL